MSGSKGLTTEQRWGRAGEATTGQDPAGRVQREVQVRTSMLATPDHRPEGQPAGCGGRV